MKKKRNVEKKIALKMLEYFFNLLPCLLSFTKMLFELKFFNIIDFKKKELTTNNTGCY